MGNIVLILGFPYEPQLNNVTVQCLTQPIIIESILKSDNSCEREHYSIFFNFISMITVIKKPGYTTLFKDNSINQQIITSSHSFCNQTMMMVNFPINISDSGLQMVYLRLSKALQIKYTVFTEAELRKLQNINYYLLKKTITGNLFNESLYSTLMFNEDDLAQLQDMAFNNVMVCQNNWQNKKIMSICLEYIVLFGPPFENFLLKNTSKNTTFAWLHKSRNPAYVYFRCIIYQSYYKLTFAKKVFQKVQKIENLVLTGMLSTQYSGLLEHKFKKMIQTYSVIRGDYDNVSLLYKSQQDNIELDENAIPMKNRINQECGCGYGNAKYSDFYFNQRLGNNSHFSLLGKVSKKHLELQLKNLKYRRGDIASVMGFAIKNSYASGEISSLILSIIEQPIALNATNLSLTNDLKQRIIGLYIIGDILYNCFRTFVSVNLGLNENQKYFLDDVFNLSKQLCVKYQILTYIKIFSQQLPFTFSKLHEIIHQLKPCRDYQEVIEKFNNKVLEVLNSWESFNFVAFGLTFGNSYYNLESENNLLSVKILKSIFLNGCFKIGNSFHEKRQDKNPTSILNNNKDNRKINDNLTPPNPNFDGHDFTAVDFSFYNKLKQLQ